MQHSSLLIQHSSLLIQHSSLLIQHSPLLIQHSSLLIQHSSFLIQNPSCLIQNSSCLTQSFSFLNQNSPGDTIDLTRREMKRRETQLCSRATHPDQKAHCGGQLRAPDGGIPKERFSRDFQKAHCGGGFEPPVCHLNSDVARKCIVAGSEWRGGALWRVLRASLWEGPTESTLCRGVRCGGGSPSQIGLQTCEHAKNTSPVVPESSPCNL